jgi:acetyl-CoA carboxylase carboxyl transferase subunit alpha
MTKSLLALEQQEAIFSKRIAELTQEGQRANIDLSDEIRQLEQKKTQFVKSIFSNLTDQQIVEIARHPERPYSLDLIQHIFSDFNELHGDRHTGDCAAIVAGLAYLNDQPLVIIAHEKGRTVQDRLKRNFGMPQPAGYRKALRIMRLANKFNLPIVTMIDTQGAYPGVNAEKNNQSEAIARNLFEMPDLCVPIISVVIGEGSSGGALAIGVADKIAMLQYSIYTTISPEGCASILFKDAKRSAEASHAMCLTATKLINNQLIDTIIPEPFGGAHRNYKETALNIKSYLVQTLATLQALPKDLLRQQRYDKLMMAHLYEDA